MKNYQIIKLSTIWSTDKLRNDVEQILNEKSRQGFDIVSVSFGVNLWWMPNAFITIANNFKSPKTY